MAKIINTQSVDKIQIDNCKGVPGKRELFKLNRQLSLLTPQEFAEKVKKGEAVCISPEDADKRVYMYTDKSGLCPQSSVQFYTEEGELMFTYPWNGQTTENIYGGEEMRYFSGLKDIREVSAFATKKGKVVIHSRGLVKDTQAIVGKELNVLQADGEYVRDVTPQFGIVYYEKSLGKDYVSKDHRLKSEYVGNCDKLFALIYMEGDAFIEHSSEHTRLC